MNSKDPVVMCQIKSSDTFIICTKNQFIGESKGMSGHYLFLLSLSIRPTPLESGE